jgi:hypothetical protein
MTIDFTCQKCDGTFDLEASELIEGEKLVCPHCETKAPTAAAEDFASALADLFAQSQALARKFQISFSFDSEEAAVAEEEEDEDEDEEEDDEDEGDDDDDEERDTGGGDENRY